MRTTYIALVLLLCTCVPAKISAQPIISATGFGVGLVSDGVCTPSVPIANCAVLDNVTTLDAGPGAEIAVYLEWTNEGSTTFASVVVTDENDDKIFGDVTDPLPPGSSDARVGFITAPTDPGQYIISFILTATNAEGRMGTDQVRFTLNVDQALPVGWESFSASVEDKQTVLLRWATAWEQENAGFVVERRDNQGRFFPLVGTIHQTLGSTATQYYFEDDRAPQGDIFYRIQQQDFSGTVSYSPIVQVNIVSGDWQPYPNPVIDRLRLPVTLTATLYNAAGAKLQRKVAGQEELDMSSLPAGTYWLHTGQSVYSVIKR
ncbi:MAG: T9SS type A sorting domain-containing protein [Bacteroidota bacterium]